MFEITNDKTIHITRGDIANISVSAVLQDDSLYTFLVNDIVRFKVVEKKDYSQVVLQKDVLVEDETTSVSLTLNKDDTKIGEIINKPVDYWYEVEVNPDTEPQTIIGHDQNGAKIFRLYPEGRDVM